MGIDRVHSDVIYSEASSYKECHHRQRLHLRREFLPFILGKIFWLILEKNILKSL